MPLLSGSNRSQLAAKLEGIYPNNFGVPQGGNGFKLNMLSESLDATIKTEVSKTIRANRNPTDVVPVSASAQGGFQFELQFKEYDPFLQAAIQQDYTAYGTDGLSAAIGTLNLAAGAITATAATAGADAFTNLAKGQWFTIKPPANANATVKEYLAGRAFKVSTVTAPTTTVITLDAATQIDIAKTGNSISNGKISSSRAYNDNVMKSYTVQVGHEDIAQFRVYKGMVVSKLDLKLSVGSIVTGSVEFMGQSFEMVQATAMGAAPADSQPYTPVNAVTGIFDIFENGQSINASTYIKSADLSIDNSLRGQEAVGVFGNAGVAPGVIRPTGKLEVYFADAVMYNKFAKNKSSSLAIPLLDVDGNGYVIYYPRIKYTAAKVNAGGQDQDNMLSMDFIATEDTDPTSPTYGKCVAIYRV